MADNTRKVISLNGKWDLAFDPKNIGKSRRWFERFPGAVETQVPGVWEQIKPGYDGVGWYRRRFHADKSLGNQAVRLRFGAVFYFCECWLNGKKLGSHEGGFTPFEFDVTSRLRSGENELVVRVINPPTNHEVDGFRSGSPLNQGSLPVGKAAWYFNFGGIWQEVELIATEKLYVEDCFVKPVPRRGKASLDVTIRNKGKVGTCELTCSVAAWNGSGKSIAERTKKIALKKGENRVSIDLPIRNARLWSPDDPFLYVVTSEIRCGKELIDRHSVRFGMREFTVRKGGFFLNGERIVPKGMLQQGMYPRTLSFPETPEIARKELELLKKNGFNFIRAHLKPPNPYYLDLADEMGILIEAEPSIGWISKSPQTERRCRTEIEGMIRRDRNHPCIVFWCLMNEAYHFRSFTMPEIKRMTDRLSRAARSMDPTRLMMDTSGGTGGDGAGTLVMLPNIERVVQIQDAHAYCALPPTDKDLADYRTMGHAGQALWISEFGAPDVPPDYASVLGKYRPSERKIALEDYQLHKDFFDSLRGCFEKSGLKKAFGSLRGFIDAVDRVRADEIAHITKAQRSNPRLAGTCFCQLADASGELFGATDIWRKPKRIFSSLVEAIKTPLLTPVITPRVLRQGGKLSLGATLINEQLLNRTYTYKIDVLDSRGKTVKSFSGRVKAEKPVRTTDTFRLRADFTPGEYTVRARLLQNGKRKSEDTSRLTVLARPEMSVKTAGVYDPKGDLANMLRKMGVKTNAFGNNYRAKNAPVVLDLREGFSDRQMAGELCGQLKKIVQLGGCAILLESEAMLLYEALLPTLIRPECIIRTIGYARRHPIFNALPGDCVIGYEYADVHPENFDSGDDILATGGEILLGAFSSHMWTRPANYFWGAAVYTIPLGRGQVVLCNMKLLDNPASPVAEILLANLINYAASVIRPGGEEKLLSRCIDPLSPKDYA